MNVERHATARPRGLTLRGLAALLGGAVALLSAGSVVLLRAAAADGLDAATRGQVASLADAGSALGLAAAVVAGAGALLLARRVRRAAADLAAAATALGAGDLGHRAPVRRPDELGALAARFNGMAERLEQRRREEEVLSRMHEVAMRMQAMRDPLTGLYNRRYLEETFPRELARASRGRAPVALVAFDVDHFKRVNDTHGHAAGDAVLREVAAVLAASFRASDVVCRHGGEEFVALLPECDAAQAAARAEAIRGRVKRLRVVHDGRDLPSITISAGVAAFPADGADRDALLRAADQALYTAKRDGRDRVVRADAPAGGGAPDRVPAFAA